MIEAVPQPVILAAFTMARRKHFRLSPAQLAARLGLRPDQITRAENADRRMSAATRATLMEFNQLEQTDGRD